LIYVAEIIVKMEVAFYTAHWFTAELGAYSSLQRDCSSPQLVSERWRSAAC